MTSPLPGWFPWRTGLVNRLNCPIRDHYLKTWREGEDLVKPARDKDVRGKYSVQY